MSEKEASAETTGASGAPTPQPQSAEPAIPFHIGAEFSTASKKLPPTIVVAASLVVLLLIIGIIAYVHRPQSQATGKIENISVIQLPGVNAVLAAVTIAIYNSGDEAYAIRSIKPSLETTTDTLTDDPASSVDFERYFSGFPTLRAGTAPPLLTDTKIQPGAELKGTIIISFPVDLTTFNGRKALKVVIQPYDQPVSLTLTK